MRGGDDSADSADSAIVRRLRSAGCVFAEEEAALLVEAAGTSAELEAMVDRRCAGVPLEHLLGWAEFSGLRIPVDAGVFVPRRRTEVVVREAAALLWPGAIVVDVCCGSGAIGAAVASAVGTIDLYATDIDPVAVASARRTLAGVGGQVFEGDLLDPLPVALRGRVDAVLANAPYVPTDAVSLMPPEARDHEPRVALDGGPDGLDVQRRLIAAAPDWLAQAGVLLVESSQEQSAGTAAAFRRSGLTARVASHADIGGTVVIGARRDR